MIFIYIHIYVKTESKITSSESTDQGDTIKVAPELIAKMEYFHFSMCPQLSIISPSHLLMILVVCVGVCRSVANILEQSLIAPPIKMSSSSTRHLAFVDLLRYFQLCALIDLAAIQWVTLVSDSGHQAQRRCSMWTTSKALTSCSKDKLCIEWGNN